MNRRNTAGNPLISIRIMESRLLDSAAVPAWDDALMRMLARSSAPSVGPSHLAIGVEDASGRVYRVVQTSGVYETARVFAALSVVLTLGLAAIGWFPRSVWLAAPAFFATDRHLVRWRAVPGGGDGEWAAGFFIRLTIAGLLCLAGVSAEYGWNQAHGLPLGGLGTAAGHPPAPVCAR